MDDELGGAPDVGVIVFRPMKQGINVSGRRKRHLGKD